MALALTGRGSTRALVLALLGAWAPTDAGAAPATLRARTLAVSDVSVSEEACGRHRADFRVTLSRPALRTVSVRYATADGTALAGTDYTARSGTLTFDGFRTVRVVRVPVADVLQPGADKTFFLNLSNPSGATIADGQGVATIQAPSVAKCDDADACTHDFCDVAAAVCRHVDVSACATPFCELGGCGADADGDGLSDAWEQNGYVDNNCNGTNDAGDLQFPRQTPYLFSIVTHGGTGLGQVYPTVADPTVPIAASNVVVTIASSGGTNVASFTYTVNGGAPQGPLTARPVVNLAGNLRLQFYIGGFVQGDTYSFNASMGSDQPVADKDVPNIYVEYDSMGWDTPGAACAGDDECVNAGGPNTHPNDVCHAGFCNHDHAPADPLFRKVVDAFAAHDIRLYIDPVHPVVPHAQVVTWARAGDGDNGPLAICAGWDVVAGDIANGNAVSFFDVKERPGSPFAADTFRKSVYHYAVLGHFNTCLTDAPEAPIGNCTQCPFDRATPSGQPAAGGSGTAELPGNDFIVSMGASFNNPLGSVARNPFAEQGVFMHELGHNLGLHHAGDTAEPAEAPNYLGVMNGRYVFSGIQHAASPGSTVSVEALRELDYSEHALDTLVESSLDESAGTSPLSSGYTGIIRFLTADGSNGRGPEAGSIDWTGDAVIDAGPVSVDLNLLNGASETMSGYRDWDHTAGPSGAAGGACVTSADCRINNIREQVHDLVDPSVDPHEPCRNGVCQSLWLASQCTRWSTADAPPRSGSRKTGRRVAP